MKSWTLKWESQLLEEMWPCPHDSQRCVRWTTLRDHHPRTRQESHLPLQPSSEPTHHPQQTPVHVKERGHELEVHLDLQDHVWSPSCQRDPSETDQRYRERGSERGRDWSKVTQLPWLNDGTLNQSLPRKPSWANQSQTWIPDTSSVLAQSLPAETSSQAEESQASHFHHVQP